MAALGRIGRLALGAAAVAVVGGAATAAGAWLDPTRAAHAYLAAFAYVASIAVGGLVLLLIGYAAGARWMAVLRRLHETLVVGFPLLALLFVPVALGVEYLYPWAGPAALSEPERHLIDLKRTYLNVPFFVARTALYFAVWILAAEVLRRWSRRRDREPVTDLGRERAFAAALLPPVGLAITFAAFDWLMSLQPTWASSMFGVYFFAGGFVAAIALLAVLARRAVVTGAVALTPHHFHALGRLLLAFVVFWAYAAFFQAFLIQIANKPSEVTFYLARVTGSWKAFVYILVLDHFALPFLLLLPRAVKYSSGYVAVVATWILVLHYVDVYWLVLPVLGGAGVAPHWLDLSALAAVGGATVAWCAWRQRGVPLLVAGDPLVPEGLHYASPT